VNWVLNDERGNYKVLCESISYQLSRLSLAIIFLLYM